MRLPRLFTFAVAILLSSPVIGQIESPPPPPPPPPPPAEEIFVVVEQMPMFPGCEDEKNAQKRKSCAQEHLLRYVYENLEYPTIALENGVEGTAIVQFVVQEDGTLDQIKMIRDPGAGIGTAAVALVEKMNTDEIRWIPGKQRGNAVPVRFNLPIRYKLPDEQTDQARGGRSSEMPAPALRPDLPMEEVDGVLSPPPPPPPAPTPTATPQAYREVFKVVEQMPRFNSETCEAKEGRARKVCAEDAMRTTIYERLEYPAIAAENRVEGTVVAQAVVLRDGSLDEIKILRDIGAGAGNELVRILETMSAPGSWITGKQRGRPVPVLINIPIKFELDN
ncbi:MAG: energy transducer TonB [Bacteroidota bacterium]